MNPRISVLLPVRDGAATIGSAVRSTLVALPEEAELLVFEDGSTDATSAVLARVHDRRLVIHRGEGRGVAKALNVLLEVARAPFVARIDADDLSLPGRFARQMRSVEQGADLVFSGHLRFGGSIAAFRQKRPWHLSPETVRVWLAFENPLTHPAMLGRTALVREAGGYRPGPAEDYDLWLRLASAGARIERQLVPGIGYRMHPGQVTAGRRYLASVLADELTRASHAEHAGSLGWRGGDVWPVLYTPARTADDQSLKAAYWAFLTDLSRSLPRFEGLQLRRALERGYPGSTAAGWTKD